MKETVYNGLWNNFFRSKAVSLDDESTALLESIFKSKVLKKDTFFLQEGEKSTEIGFITKGIFRSYYIDNLGVFDHLNRATPIAKS